MTLNFNNYRYERKFVISGLSMHEILQSIKLHPAIFSEIYHIRKINNIYFDTLSFQSFFDNIDGLSNRKKIRIRWYGKTFDSIKNPVLEIKRKQGMLGLKQSYPCFPFIVENNFVKMKINSILQNSKIPEGLKLKLKYYNPVLLNSYHRKYFQSVCKSFRITVDSNQEFYRIRKNPDFLLDKIRDNNNIIMELKYNYEKSSEAENITNNFPFRITKNSKYINGLSF